MKTQASRLAFLLASLAGCADVLGFEDALPPMSDAGGAATAQTSSTVGGFGGAGGAGEVASASTASTAGSGGNAPTGCADPALNIVFVTTDPIDPAGVGMLDAHCNAQAAPCGGKQFVAWLSFVGPNRTDVDARERIPQPGEWHRPDGMRVAADHAQLTTGPLDNPVSVAADGAHLNVSVWTGTNQSGNATGSDCAAWNSGDPTTLATVGSSVRDGPKWTNDALAGCQEPRHLYCFEKR